MANKSFVVTASQQVGYSGFKGMRPRTYPIMSPETVALVHAIPAEELPMQVAILSAYLASFPEMLPFSPFKVKERNDRDRNLYGSLHQSLVGALPSTQERGPLGDPPCGVVPHMHYFIRESKVSIERRDPVFESSHYNLKVLLDLMQQRLS